MRNKQENGAKFFSMHTAACLALMFMFFAVNAFSQSGSGQQELIADGSLIIPMDNYMQGNNSSSTFNLRAYGLANRLLQNDIPVKWAIKPGKAKDDNDFSATVTRIAGNRGGSGGNYNFRGGPFIIQAEYAAAAMPHITAFNNSIGNPDNRVTVYRMTADKLIDIRYTLTHKPLVAIGPDGGNFGTGVYQSLLQEAMIPNYQSVTDESMQPNSCFTLAMQAHSTTPTWVSSYRNFVENGGNLMLQCASVGTFENHATYGHFQTTAGFFLHGTNAPNNTLSGVDLSYPNGYMPFNQFIGNLNGSQDGAVTDFRLANGSVFNSGGHPRTGPDVSVGHSEDAWWTAGDDRDAYVATVSKVGNVGRAGGHVFALGGHDYDRGGNNIGNLNGKRMALNSLFVPVTRPCADLSIPLVDGYKWVRLAPGGDVDGDGRADGGDTLAWTIIYVNRGLAPVVNFQIADLLQTDMVNVAQPIVTVSGNGTTASLNPAYNGAGNNNLLAPGAVLGVNGKITVEIRTKINDGFVGFLKNQPTATGVNITDSGVQTDNIDEFDVIAFDGGDVTAPSESIVQTLWQSDNIDPTVAPVVGPTSAPASVTGRVSANTGAAIRGATIEVQNAETGEIRRVLTNAFGVFTIDGLHTGAFYSISVNHSRYFFANNTHAFTLHENVTGLAFIGEPVSDTVIRTAPVKTAGTSTIRR